MTEEWREHYTAEWNKIWQLMDTLLADERATAHDIAVAAAIWDTMQVRFKKRLKELDPDGSAQRAVAEVVRRRYGAP